MRKKCLSVLCSSLLFAQHLMLTAHAEGDVATAVTNASTTAKEQAKTIVNNVVFPVMDVILVVLLFVKIAGVYLEYRKHGQLEWTPITIIFGGLLFSLTAPLYLWSIID